MADGAFTFVSWVRRGLATGIAAIDDGTAIGPSTIAVVEVGFNNDPVTKTKVNLPLVGSGDIVGLDPAAVCRVWPHAEDLDAEYIPYPLIEFDQADLPWRYSPAQARTDTADSSIDQLRPWITLVVIPAGDGAIAAPVGTQKLSVLTVTNTAALPSLNELWAWAHTQFEGSALDPGQARSKMEGAPGLFSARLMSPRLLQPNVEYIACLVPTFERGRRVGLGTPPDSVDASLGWDLTGSGPFQLPVYYSWRFRTGNVGDFEQVARLIQPFDMPETLGFRTLDVSEPGFGLHAAANGPLPIEGALLSIRASRLTVNWPDSNGNTFIGELSQFINDGAAGRVPRLVPPLYGEWYAASTALDATAGGSNPRWFRQLNVDPRYRVAAALGTRVIQREQQALLASGWDQVEEIATINDQLRVLQLARGLLVRVHLRHFQTLSLQRFYQLTLRLHTQVTCGGQSICQNVAGSPIVPGFLSTQWLRWARPLGSIGRLQARASNTEAPNLIGLLNDCRKPARDPDPPIDLGQPPGLPGGIPCELVEQLMGLGGEVLVRWGLLILWVTRKLLVERNGQCFWIGLRALRYAIGLIQIAAGSTAILRYCRFSRKQLSSSDVLGIFPQPAAYDGGDEDSDPLTLPPLPGNPTDTDSAAAAAIRDALVRLFDSFAAPPDLTCPPSIDLEGCRTTITTSLDPRLTIVETIGSRLYIDPSLMWINPKDPIAPLFVQPSFERPMYVPLKEISNDWILPGLDNIPQNTIGLAVLNQRFIEAYMVGLNHEMTRELLWNEFPTDQRGTYFRQFWDVAGCNLDFGSPLPPEQMRDIHPLRQWSASADLGENSPRPISESSQPFLVLVVRAQLIQKYPNVIVYAQRVIDGTLTDNQIHPMFYALLAPDIAFYGFKLTEAELRSDSNWYFVLQEQPGDPKFADPAEPNRQSPGYTSSSSVGQNAGIVAQQTFLQPFRLAVQASTMLPPPQA
jgi:hypothetical protein